MAAETPSDSADNQNTETEPTTEPTTEPQTSESEEGATPKAEPTPDPAKLSLQADLHKERKQRQAEQAKVTELTAKVDELTTKASEATALQTKYDRLEAFLQAAGGPLASALDSRSLTHKLFETDTDVSEIATEWSKAHPSTTSVALGSGSATNEGKVSMNDLLRSAVK